jgi:hypothetical protein
VVFAEVEYSVCFVGEVDVVIDGVFEEFVGDLSEVDWYFGVAPWRGDHWILGYEWFDVDDYVFLLFVVL